MNHDEFSHADAAYVLGALEPHERRAYEEHLRSCAACARSVQELAGLPALLAHVDASAVERPADVPPVPDTLLPRLLSEVRRTRRHRVVWGLAGSAAAALVAVAGTTVWLQQGDPAGEAQPGLTATPSASGSEGPAEQAPGEEMRQVDQDVVRASLAMEQVPWGTRLRLTCSYTETADPRYAGDPPTYALVVHTRGGAEQVATWRAVPGRTTTLDAATAADPSEITSVDVRTVSGTRVLELDS